MIALSTSIATSVSVSHRDPNLVSPSSGGNVEAFPSSSPEEELKKKVNAEALTLLLKRQWDPFQSVVHGTKCKKLQSNPIFLFVPHGPPMTSPLSTKRLKAFSSMLSSLGKVYYNPASQKICSFILQTYVSNLLNSGCLRHNESCHCW